MLKIEYDILSYIRDHKDCSWIDVLNAFDPDSSCNATDAILRCLRDDAFVETYPPGQTPPLCRVQLPPQAVRSLSLYEQKRKKEQEDRRLRKEELLFTAKISLMSALVGGLIGLSGTLINLFVSG